MSPDFTKCPLGERVGGQNTTPSCSPSWKHRARRDLPWKAGDGHGPCPLVIYHDTFIWGFWSKTMCGMMKRKYNVAKDVFRRLAGSSRQNCDFKTALTWLKFILTRTEERVSAEGHSDRDLSFFCPTASQLVLFPAKPSKETGRTEVSVPGSWRNRKGSL